MVGRHFWRCVMNVELAVNLWDVERIPAELQPTLLAGALNLDSAVRLGNGPEDTGLVFTCELLKAACICDMMRSHDRQVGDKPTRVYYNKGRGWRSVPSGATLTIVRSYRKGERGVELNPLLFTAEVDPPTQSGPVQLGGTQ